MFDAIAANPAPTVTKTHNPPKVHKFKKRINFVLISSNLTSLPSCLILVKRNEMNKEFTESRINGFPYSNKLKIGDKILVSETSYGIYAYGSVTKVDEIIEFNSVNEILNYTEKNKIKDIKYWYNLILRFKQKKENDNNAVLRFQRYFIQQKLLNRTIPFFDLTIQRQYL